jgi:hypothetical protein
MADDKAAEPVKNEAGEAPAPKKETPSAPAPVPAKETAPAAPAAPAAEAPKEAVAVKVEPKKKIVGIPPDKLKLFDRYDMSNITVTDAGLAKYINLDPVIVPHTGAKHANQPFAKCKMNIVERLVNNMMRSENYTARRPRRTASSWRLSQ